MGLGLFLFGVWDQPVSDYLWFYFGFGILGFLLCYLHRFFIFVGVPVLIWFTVSDFRAFYRYNVTPDNFYVFQTFVSILFAAATLFLGAKLSRRKTQKLA